MKQETVWDTIAEKWHEYRNEPSDYVKNFLKDKEGRILDLCCGSGRNFSQIKGQIYGVDFSAKMLEIAEKNANKLKPPCILIKSQTSKLPFEDNFFDCAIFIAGLHCIKGKKKRECSLKELFRVLKKGKQAIISVWSSNQKRVKGKKGDIFVPWTVEGKKYKRYYYLYEKDELEKELKKAGFHISEIKEEKRIIAIVEK